MRSGRAPLVIRSLSCSVSRVSSDGVGASSAICTEGRVVAGAATQNVITNLQSRFQRRAGIGALFRAPGGESLGPADVSAAG